MPKPSAKRKNEEDKVSRSKRISTLPEQESDLAFAFTRTAKIQHLIEPKAESTNGTTSSATTIGTGATKRPARDLFAEHFSRNTKAKIADGVVATITASPSKSNKTRRRSSFSRRGKRASSIGNGFIALPHSNVKMADFYKHISPELPEPLRMRQLLAWCLRRVIDDQKVDSKDVHALKIARVIQEDIYKDLVDNKIDVSWYSRNDDRPRSNLKPHPVNEENRKKIAELEDRIASLRKEDSKWAEISRRFSNFPEPMDTDAGDDINAALLSPEQRDLLARIDQQDTSSVLDIPVTSQKWKELVTKLEFCVDNLHHKLYNASQFNNVAHTFSKGLLAKMASALENREHLDLEPPVIKELMMVPDAMELLRALSVA